MDLNLKGRVAFVTGASRGIGRAIATAFAAEGVSVGLFGRDLERCNAVAQELRSKHSGIRAAVIELDLAKPKMIKPAVEKGIAELGGVDILVNCAGGAYRGRLEEIPDDLWESYFAIKPLGLIRMTREAAPYLRKSSQGRIINISGTRGREPQGVQVMSGPINLGTQSITKAMANEFGKNGVTVNSISPGSTDTGRWTELVNIHAKERGISVQEAEKHLVADVPMGRVVKPQDISDLAVFLASARAGMITGCNINVDGGRTRGI
ncbi:MAG TPA: SDR family oxidoreductase [Burkholderiales bacterium]|nr:SDR family oxidoreductase [Burkholderiales bacterium]